jgi:hypothetical protein
MGGHECDVVPDIDVPVLGHNSTHKLRPLVEAYKHSDIWDVCRIDQSSHISLCSLYRYQTLFSRQDTDDSSRFGMPKRVAPTHLAFRFRRRKGRERLSNKDRRKNKPDRGDCRVRKSQHGPRKSHADRSPSANRRPSRIEEVLKIVIATTYRWIEWRPNIN